MNFQWSDFFAGFFLANAIPHLLFGQMNIKFFSGLGFGNNRNIGYSIWNVALAGATLLFFQGADALMGNATFWGLFSLLAIYAVTGKFFYRLWNQPKNDNGSGIN